MKPTKKEQQIQKNFNSFIYENINNNKFIINIDNNKFVIVDIAIKEHLYTCLKIKNFTKEQPQKIRNFI